MSPSVPAPMPPRVPVRVLIRVLIGTLVITSIAAASACGSAARQRLPACTPEAGMTTDQLVECGCLLNDSGGLAAASMARAAGGPGVQTVIIVNYICPLGELGVARVAVTNGVAEAVYY